MIPDLDRRLDRAPVVVWPTSLWGPAVHRLAAAGDSTLCGYEITPSWGCGKLAPADLSRCHRCSRISKVLRSEISTAISTTSAAPATFREHAARRLAAGADLYGDRSYRRPVGDLLAEMLEEAADIATWGEITRVALQRSGVEPEAAYQVELAIREATALAQTAWNTIDQAKGLVS